jgi:hypothetical protein
MSIYKKTFSAAAPAGGKPTGRPGATKSANPSKAPVTSSDNKRAFDARPKPSDDNRREERVRPTQHVDPAPRDPFDQADGE